MPTGGVNEKNLREYLNCDKVACCGGSWMVKGEFVRNKEFSKKTGKQKRGRICYERCRSQGEKIEKHK